MTTQCAGPTAPTLMALLEDHCHMDRASPATLTQIPNLRGVTAQLELSVLRVHCAGGRGKALQQSVWTKPCLLLCCVPYRLAGQSSVNDKHGSAAVATDTHPRQSTQRVRMECPRRRQAGAWPAAPTSCSKTIIAKAS